MDTKIILDYLSDLSANNDREWYHAHKAEYNEYDPAAQQQSMKKSRIDGISLVLAVSDTLPSQTVCWAEMDNQGIYFRIVASGMDESSFTDIIREIVQFQKLPTS